MSKGRPSEEKIPIVVVYKKGKKHFLQSFEGIELDSILSNKLRKPIIANENEIIEIGIGKSFIEKYKKQFEIKD